MISFARTAPRSPRTRGKGAKVPLSGEEQRYLRRLEALPASRGLRQEREVDVHSGALVSWRRPGAPGDRSGRALRGARQLASAILQSRRLVIDEDWFPIFVRL